MSEEQYINDNHNKNNNSTLRAEGTGVKSGPEHRPARCKCHGFPQLSKFQNDTSFRP